MAGGIRKTAPGRGRRRSRRGARMSEINVTPFVDVMLVLLIVFMVAAPLLTVGVPVDLPKTAAKPLDDVSRVPAEVIVDAAGAVYLDDEPSSVAELPAKLRAHFGDDGETGRVFIRGDTAAAYGTVMQVMGALNAEGFRNIGLVTQSAGPAQRGEQQ